VKRIVSNGRVFWVGLSVLLATLGASVAVATVSQQGLSMQGLSMQGLSMQGLSMQGLSMQGLSMQGLSMQGLSMQGLSMQGLSMQGLSMQGLSMQGLSMQGLSMQGLSMQGLSMQGLSMQGLSMQGMQERAVDRLRGLGAAFQFSGLAYANAQLPSLNLQGLQSAGPINYVQITNPMSGVRLQAGPTDASPGSYIYVPGLAGTPSDLKGSFWNMSLSDTCTADSQCASPATCVNGSCSVPGGGVILYISDVETDTHQNSSKYPSNDDIYLYTVYYRQPATGEWASLCPVDTYGDAHAMAVPLNPNDWTSDASRSTFAFACTGSGVAAKCARNWGYKPWKTVTENVWNPTTGFTSTQVPLAPFYNACLGAARADYCQDNTSFTENGTTVDLFDTLDGVTSINSTVGLPFAPHSTGVMLHEEYQISALNIGSSPARPYYVSETPIPDEFVRSGLESSRYADLDPGRSCPADQYIDRCDPTEPYACYRAANMSTTPYGAFLAVNSPRHCSHNEDQEGEALDPMCNECVHRVCQVDPTCCGDPGSTFYPGSLVWDSRCTTIRNQVCKSSPDESSPWPPGVVAPPASSHVPVFLSGAIGSFEGIVTGSDGKQYAEGWACDPDFPTASSPIQISVGGEMGASGATLYTATADAPLVPGWRETVAVQCGGAGRHGFHFALPAGSGGKDVAVYGIDMNVPGAPFSLLRGGEKTAPGGPALPPPQAAIWTGWVEPAASNTYTFAVTAGSADKYRVWVNGFYVAGNWVDPDPSVPGAFTLPPPSPYDPPVVYLQKGVRYGVRVEYLRPAPLSVDSQFVLQWSQAGGALASIPSTGLYPMAQGSGNGLLGTYYSGIEFPVPGLPVPQQLPPQTYGAVDYLWTGGNPPLPGVSVGDSFAADFGGQIVPPISGDYTFSAVTDGVVQISVNGQVVTDTTRAPPATDPATCPHDICTSGAAVSKTCSQGYFCSAQICLADPSCCSITWDARCVQEVAHVCGLNCSPTPPVTISLQAGVKYDIDVQYQHRGTDGSLTVLGAQLSLRWALAGTQSDVIPLERLFAATPAPAPGLGVGLNAAYFSDVAFKNEYLDHVESALSFEAGSPPDATRATSLTCGGAGEASCDSGGVALGAPTLTDPSEGATAVGPTVTVKGGGAVRGATVTIWDGSTAVASVAIASDGSGAGIFSVNLTLATGPHTLTATQSAGGLVSTSSTALDIQVVAPTNPNAPGAPTITQPPNGLVSGAGQIQVAGTAAPGATVTVTAGGTTATFTADASGAWGGTLTLSGPGSYDLSVTQTVGGVTGPTGPSENVKVTLPPLTLTSPTDGATVPTTVAISGQGADPALGVVHVADGDGNYFAERDEVAPASNGSFGDSLSLDYGQHKLKVFQQANGLDGVGVIRTVLVKPPTAGLAITSPKQGDVISANVTVTGIGLPRTGLPGTVNVYQGTKRLSTGPLDKFGNFSIPVTLDGAGHQPLSISQVASSLSGAGSVESDHTLPINVLVIPPAPVITAPSTGSTQDSLTVAVTGTAISGSIVTIAVDSAAQPPVTAGPDGAFATSLSLSRGTRHLTATQSVDGAVGPSSVATLVTLGDVTPPVVTVTDASGAPLRELVVVAPDQTGIAVDYSARVSATDNGSSLTPTCLPPSGSVFQLGTTTVTCDAVDAAGNQGSTSFLVTVKTNEAPVFSCGDSTGGNNCANLTAEAQGPSGAAVSYQVSATGFIADCAPAGSGSVQPCVSWHPAYNGLGFTPITMTQDPNDGTLYAAIPGFGVNSKVNDLHEHLLKSTDGGGRWTDLPTPGADGFISRIVVVGGSLATLYVTSTYHGTRISRDGGQTWASALDGQYINFIWDDPADPMHLFSTTVNNSGALYETHDGWTTWSDASGGLPGPCTGIAMDRLNPGRVYATVEAAPSESSGTNIYNNIYLRVGNGGWERLSVPPYPSRQYTNESDTLRVSPGLDACHPGLVGQTCAPCPAGQGQPGGSCQAFPTVFFSSVVSRDGGATWSDLGFNILELAFFQPDPRIIYAQTGYEVDGPLVRSNDAGLTWTPVPGLRVIPNGSLLVDHQDPQTVYITSSYYEGDLGVGAYKTTNGGQSWMCLSAPGLSLSGAKIKDVVADPVDPKVAYLLSDRGGVFKTIDGGDSWLASNTGLDPEAFEVASKLQVDNLKRSNVYAGKTGLWKSADGAGNWTNVGGGNDFALDPALPNTLLSVNGGLNDTSNVGAAEIVNGVDQPFYLSSFNVDDSNNPSTFPVTFNLQSVPDAARTVVMSWTGPDGDVGLFSLAQAQQSSWAGAGVTHGGLGVANVLFDGSDGTNRLFAGGAALTGRDPSVLYRVSVDDVGTAPLSEANWVALAPGGGPVFSDFTRLLVDPATGGQALYTIGNDHTLWESHDGGGAWQRDGLAPPLVTNAWMSPVDGSLYATSDPLGGFSDYDVFGHLETSPQFAAVGRDVWSPGVLWKRSVGTGTPPGARVVEGDLRSVCTGGDGLRAVNPGSMFPIGKTTLTCTATDVFGNITTQGVTITVSDTTPPVLTVPTQVTATAPPGGTAEVNFNVTAQDAVGGDVTSTVVCTPASGSEFHVGVTTVLCTATDHAVPVNTAHASFPVVVSQDGSPTLGIPILNTPGDQVAEATGPDGATIPLTVTAVTGSSPPTSLIPTCTPSLSSTFAIGVTDVTCSATDGALTATQSFRVTVKDTQAPVLSVPTALSFSAQGPWGAKVIYTATATDIVDGAVVPSCTPESGVAFPLGTSSVTCWAVDRTGNRSTARFNVTVQDRNPPLLHLTDVTTDATDFSGARVAFNATATDLEDPFPVVDCLPPSGSLFSLGDTTVSCTATDSAKNEAQGSFVVHVVDASAPTITVPPTITLEAAGPSGSPATFAASAFDAVSLNLIPTCDRVTNVGVPTPVVSGAMFPIGDNLVTCVATDLAGNTGSNSFTIIVRDTTPPVLVLPPPITAAADSTGTATVTFTVTGTDTVSGTVPAGCTPKPGSRFSVGTTVVSCTARDAAGNQASGTFTVTVSTTNLGQACKTAADCPGGYCTDGVCCSTACGNIVGGDPNDCQACSIAAGGTVNGTCTPLPATKVCRPSAGSCDLAETCDGTSLACPADGFASATTVCRASGGACDVAETCSGSSAACPADKLASASTVCRASAGACDVAETCSGSSAACPADGFAPATTVCRASAGTCDVAETCTGSSAACPADKLAPANTVCRASAGACDVAETCTGSSAACPADKLAPANTVCRASAGACDVAETCSGSSAACPADQLASATTVCRASAGACDVAETCTGSSAACPADGLASATTVCRASAGACDVAETCTGSSAACPADKLAPATTVCRASAGACDVAESCSGSSAACPADGFASATAVCRASAGACDIAETCSGTSVACPADKLAPATTVCRASAGACDVVEICSGSSAACPADKLAPATTVCRASAGTCDVAETCTGSSAACPANGFVAAGKVCQPAANVCQSPGVCTGTSAACPPATSIPGCKIDTTPPVWSNIPATIIAYATSTSGAKVTYKSPTATDAVDGVRPVTCALASGSTFPINKTTVTCSASDKSGNSSTATFTVWVQYQAPGDGTFFLIPIRSNGSSIFPIGPLPLPVRFRLTGASAGITTLVATFAETKTSSSILGTANDVSDETVSDTGTTFIYRPLLQWYAYRWKTSNQTQGTYQIKADLGDGVVHQINVSLKTTK
jgi:photosystem II stability/assembly factor-like uncharacterized protein